MGTTQPGKESAPGKLGLMAATIFGAVLLSAAIWSLSRALSNSSPPGSVVLSNEVDTMDVVLSQDAIEMQDKVEQWIAPPVQKAVAAQPAVTLTNRNNDAVKLQKARAKVNQKIVDRMKQYIRDNPNLDTRELEKQIKRRENQSAPNQMRENNVKR